MSRSRRRSTPRRRSRAAAAARRSPPEGAKTRTADASNTAPSRALRATAARWARRAASRSAWA
eukprot:31483-Pelagococcus_subviridis.AAC.16